MERGGREGATLKGTGLSEGEGPASDQMVLPQIYWTLRFGDPPGLNLQNGSLACSVLHGVRIIVFVSQYLPFLLLEMGKSSFSLIWWFYKLNGIMAVNKSLTPSKCSINISYLGLWAPTT